MIISGTGLSGLVGSRVVELNSNKYEWNSLGGVKRIDITDYLEVHQALATSKADVVVHFAAFTDLNEAQKQSGDIGGMCYRLNVIGTKNIVEACKKYNKFLVHISTDAVFGGIKTSPYIETDTPDPIEWYGITKFLAEQEVQKSGIPSAIIRIAYPFRARFERKIDFVRKIKKHLSEEKVVSMFEDTTFTPTFIDDIAHGVGIIIKKRPEGIFHLVGSTYLSPYEAAKEIANVFQLDESLIRPQKLDQYLREGGRPYPRNASMSNQKANNELDLSMMPFLDALRYIKKQLENQP